MTRLAVVIPTHDDGDHVAEAVASVCEAESVELVVIDDGSTDATSLASLDRLRAQGVRVITRPNGGPSAARTTGLLATRAPLVLHLDADDLLEPGALARAADLLDRHPEAAFVYGDYLEFGDKTERYRMPPRFLPWSMTYLNLYTATCLLRRVDIQAAGGWPSMNYEDWALFLALMQRDRFGVHMDGVLFRRRLHGAERRLGRARSRHAELYGELQRRYPAAFARRREWALLERPPRWKRLSYPLVYGSRRFVPARLEAMLRRSALWTRLRPLRR